MLTTLLLTTPGTEEKVSSGYVLGGKIAPIFFNTLEDAGALAIECDVSQLTTGQEIIIKPYEGKIIDASDQSEITNFQLKTDVILDEVRANGRINLIIGRQLTDKTRSTLGKDASDVFVRPHSDKTKKTGYTLAQKMVGKACGVEGVRPGDYCEPIMTTVGSQDTTGPMTRDELKEKPDNEAYYHKKLKIILFLLIFLRKKFCYFFQFY